MKNKKHIITVLSLVVLSVSIIAPASQSVQAKKKKSIPTCVCNMFVGDSYTLETKTAKVAKVSKKKMVSYEKNYDGFLQITAKKAGTVTITLKNKKKQSNLKLVISGNKDNCVKFTLGKQVFGYQGNAGQGGLLYEATLENTSKIPLTSAGIRLNNANFLGTTGETNIYCLIPGKKIKVFVVVTGGENNVSLSHVIPTYNRFAKYTDMTDKVKLIKKVDADPTQSTYTFAWESKFDVSSNEKADFAIDTTGYSDGGVPVKSKYIGGDIDTLNRIESIYTSMNGNDGVDCQAVTRAVKYTFNTLKWA